MVGSGVIEAGSLGAATPAAAAAFIAGALATISGLLWYAAALIDLADCMERAGKPDAAAAARARAQVLQEEAARLQALVDRVQAAVAA